METAAVEGAEDLAAEMVDVGDPLAVRRHLTTTPAAPARPGTARRRTV